MPTSEPELTEQVDLCDPTGRHLNPAARGWSRHPLHRANLAGGWGRTKRWDYWAVLAPDHAVSITYADVDYLGIVDVWWCHLPSGRTGGRSVVVPLGLGVDLPEVHGTTPLRWSGRGLDCTLSTEEGDNGPAGTTHISATWTEGRTKEPARLELTIDQPLGHESCNVVIGWSDSRFQFTSKHQARPVRGRLLVGDEEVVFGGVEPSWGVLDVGRGRWPYRTRWNWGGGAGRAVDGPLVGVQLGGRWTEGTGSTENAVIVAGRAHKIGEELAWEYSWDRPLNPWRVIAPDRSIELTLTPRFDRHSRTELGVLGTEVRQVFGRWSGTVVGEDGTRWRVEDMVGFAEESRSRW